MTHMYFYVQITMYTFSAQKKIEFEELSFQVCNLQMLFCVGNFFGDDNSEWELYKSGQEKGSIAVMIIRKTNYVKHILNKVRFPLIK